MRVMAILGTRPEAIKMAPVLRALSDYTGVDTRICVTGQHREMLDQVLQVFEMAPDYDLDLMRPNQKLSDLTARILNEVTGVIAREQPDLVLVQGDTTTAMAGALGAFYLRIPVGHVEAGLRTADIASPFPEEMNRRVISTLATWHFAPTPRAAHALIQGGVSSDQIYITGNTVIDALLATQSRTLPPAWLHGFGHNDVILVTAHRRENFGEPLRCIFEAIRLLAARNPNVEIVYPVHLNPNVRELAAQILGGRDRVHLLPPVDYAAFVHLLARATLVLTDSGGIQEEAPAFGKPVLVLRSETERPEAVEAGTARLVGTNTETILREAERLLRDPDAYAAMARAVNVFGDGTAAIRIAEILTEIHGVVPALALA